ncbi:MAG: PAS domain-containing protein [Ferrovibrio sp.]
MDRTADPVIADSAWPATLPAPLEEFLRYWQALRAAAGGIPPKRSVDALLIPRHLLPGIGLIEWQPHDAAAPADGGRLFYRLLGTAHYNATAHDYTGRYFDDLYTREQVARLNAEYLDILRNGKPHFARRGSLKHGREFVMFQRILAPLLDDRGTARHLIGYWWWEPIRS